MPVNWRDCIVPIKQRNKEDWYNAYVWIAYQKESPYLPLAVAENANELARMVGKAETTILSDWSKYCRGIKKRSQYHRVKVGL